MERNGVMDLTSRLVVRSIVRCVIAGAVVLLLGAERAQASAIVYTDLASWTAAVSGPVQTITFEENDSSGSASTAYGDAPATFDGVTFQVEAVRAYLWTVDPSYGFGYDEIGTGDVLHKQGNGFLSVSLAGATA